MDVFHRIYTWIVPDEVVDAGMFHFRAFTEHEYLTNLKPIPAAAIESWRGTNSVDLNAYVWPKPLLVAKGFYLRKNYPYWTVWVKNECRLRSKNGLVIPRQCLTTVGLRDSFFARAFAAVTDY